MAWYHKIPGVKLSDEVEDLYSKGEEKDLILAQKAGACFHRISDILEFDAGIKVSEMFQWSEERSPNHHPHTRILKYPAGVIICRGIENITNAENIFRSQELRSFNLRLVKVANSSGGIKEDTVNEYAYSLSEEDLGPCYKAIEALTKEFQDKECFRPIHGNLADYILFEGLDRISEGRIYIEIGNIPIVTKSPRTIFGRKKQYGFIPTTSKIKIR